MKKIHRTRAAILLSTALLSALALTGCGASGVSRSSGASCNIALLLPDEVTVRWEQQDKPVFESTIKKIAPGCTFTSYNARGSAETQLNQAESAVANGAKVVVIAPIDYSTAGQIVQKVHDGGAKVISYASIINSPLVNYGVTTNIAKIGAQQAQSLVDHLADKGITSGNLVMLNGDPTDAFGRVYKRGALSVFDKTKFKIAASYDAVGWSGDLAQQQMTQAITKLGKDGFVAVYAANDQLAGGAIAAMKAAGIDPKSKPTTGQDGSAAALQRILVGTQFNTIDLPIKEFAANTAKLAVAISKGEKPPAGIVNGTVEAGGKKIPAYLYATHVITVKNVSEMLEPAGFWKTGQICTAAYKRACAAAGIK